MFIIDPLQKDDARIRPVALVIIAGMAILAAGLWRLQVVAAPGYKRSEAAQSVRLVRVPAIRGRILDRHGVCLAENRPSYDVNLYLEELRSAFRFEYTNNLLPAYRAAHAGARPRGTAGRALEETARLNVFTNTVQAVASALDTNLPISAHRFLRHYKQALALPLELAENLSPPQMALFFEQCQGIAGIDLEVQAVRHYPFQNLAGLVLGHLRRSDEADNDPEPLVFRYRLRDYEGIAGIEGRFDELLRGRAGVKALRVNSQGYRHEERILQPTEPGATVRLTLDVQIQAAAERALARASGTATRGAVVVMDVQNGELLALVSLPSFDPNQFLGGMSREEFARLNDEKLRPQWNRTISGAYAPGSVFKPIVGLAALEAGVLDPDAKHAYPGYWPIGNRRIDDTAPAGDYDFKRAFKRSSNAYFIDHGLRAGRARIVAMAQRFGLGESTGFDLGPEASGFLPDDAHVAASRRKRDPWTETKTAFLSIGQGALTVSPLQMGVVTAAIANGGRVLEPRIIQRVEAADGTILKEMPPVVRHEVGVHPAHLALIRDAMLADVEEPEGTGREAAIAGFRVCGKTGTAEITRGGQVVDKITWFIAFGPYEAPRYAVVVAVESGGSGAVTSAPVARDIFKALQLRDRTLAGQPFARVQKSEL
jgi:penicillin-binding protein 2